MRILLFASLMWISCSLSAQSNWTAMDERFNAHFGAYRENPMELHSFARAELFSALEAGDCEAALVAQSLLIRAAMILEFPPDDSEWAPTLPPGCRLDYPRLNYDMGCRLMQAGRMDEAELRFGLAAESPKWASHAWNMVGRMRHHAGHLKEAAIAWHQAHEAVEGQPNPSILINLGLVHSEQGDWSGALHWFQLALEANEWNEQTNAYTFLEDIEQLILLNLLRSAVNVGDTVIADQTWNQLRPSELMNDPVRQLRPQLDYALWRNRPDLVEGLVRVYDEHVEADSAYAVDHLDDRALLFHPWRDATGWSLKRTIDLLAQAEGAPALRRHVHQTSSEKKGTVVRASQVRWLHAGSWASMLLLAAVALTFALRWQHFRTARRQLESLDDAKLFTRLQKVLYSDEGDRHRQLAVAAVVQRLDRRSVMSQLSDAQLNRLNAQEAKVLEWILDGRSSQEISESLKVTVQRVYNIRSAIRMKLDLAPGQNWDTLKSEHRND